MNTQLDQDKDKDKKAEIHFKPHWVFDLGTRDSLLVLKALGGRLTEAEEAAAKELGDRLTLLRATAGRQYMESLARAESAVLSGGFTESKK